MFQSINPATGVPGDAIAELTSDEVDARIARAHDAFQAWRVTPVEERARIVGAIGEWMEANKRRLAEIATREMGKTLASGIAEVEKCAAAFRYYAQQGPAMLAPRPIEGASGGGRVLFQPIGPVLAIMPWNFPYWQAVRFMAPTLLAGIVGLLKHASLTQGCAAALEEAAIAGGAPAGVFQNLAIKSDKVDALIADPRIAAVTLTGSEGAGMKVAEAAGRQLKKVVLELGGSDPFIVMPSADLDRAAKVAAQARTQNAGQSCICAKRMIVHADVYDTFLEKFSAAMQAVRVGDPMAADSDIGPLSSAEQRDTVLAQLEGMKRAGARLLFGGEPLPGKGAYLSPGVLVDVPQDDPVAQEEVFGPIAMVFRAADLDAAVALANDVPFGLGASVWTTDPAERARFEQDVEAGMVAINQMLASSPETPFGGIKRSGHGRELGRWGLHEFMNLKTVLG